MPAWATDHKSWKNSLWGLKSRVIPARTARCENVVHKKESIDVSLFIVPPRRLQAVQILLRGGGGRR